MKNTLKVGAVLLAGMAPQISSAQQVLPGHIVSCYRSIYGDIVAGNITESRVHRYINPENVLRNMRNPITPEMEQKVIDSALNFARFLERRIKNESGNYTANDVVFTRYSA